jgi:hypothetical protein
LCAEQAPFDQHATVDRRHGREEHRRVELFAVAGRLPPEWQAVIACAARITRLSWCNDTRTGLWQPRRETACYVSQIELTAERFGRAVRAHWGIENRAHHVRDRILGEDASRIRCHPHLRPHPLVRAEHPARPRRHQRERGNLHQRPQPPLPPRLWPTHSAELNSPAPRPLVLSGSMANKTEGRT